MPITTRRETILIIDDEECMTDACSQVLANEGYKTETANSGELGLIKAREIFPDVLLIDLDMPGMNGFEVLDKLSLYSPEAVSILVTGRTTIDLDEEVIAKGRAQSYLMKPFTAEQLKAVVEDTLRRKKRIK